MFKLTIKTPDRRVRRYSDWKLSNLAGKLIDISNGGGLILKNRDGSETKWPCDRLKITIEPEKAK